MTVIRAEIIALYTKIPANDNVSDSNKAPLIFNFNNTVNIIFISG